MSVDATGARQTGSGQEKPRISGYGLQQLLRPSSTMLAGQPTRNVHHASNGPDASLPPGPEQLRYPASFQQPDERRSISAACNGISVPVQQSLPDIEQRIYQAETRSNQAGIHPGRAVTEDAGQAPSFRHMTRSARSPADRGAVLAG